MAGAAAVLASPCAAREDPLQDGINALANEVLAIRELRGPLQIEWRNDSSLSAGQSAALQNQFSARLLAVRGLIGEDAAAPALRVALRDTATQLLIIARVPTAEGEQVRMVQISRIAFVAEDAPQTAPFLRKQLLWKQREPILDAMERSVGGTSTLVVLGRETLWVYGSAQDPLQLQEVAHIPGANHASRSLAGRLRFPKGDDWRFVAELPGKVCSGDVSERIAMECAPGEQRGPGGTKGRSATSASDSVELVAPCDHSVWTVTSDGEDWSKADRLSLRDSRSAASDRAGALDTTGPVVALESGPEGATSIAVVLNLSTGEYEIYRLALACHN
jgi:hypothetical protein